MTRLCCRKCAQVGPSYGRKMMTGYLKSKGVSACEGRVGNALKDVHEPYQLARQQVNDIDIKPTKIQFRNFVLDAKPTSLHEPLTLAQLFVGSRPADGPRHMQHAGSPTMLWRHVNAGLQDSSIINL